MIETIKLTKYFDDFIAVKDVTLSVQPGEVFALLGPNGAGKTTTVRMLTSILSPTSGTAKVTGYDVVTQPELVRAQLGVLTEHHGLYLRMNGREYIAFYANLYGLDASHADKRATKLAERFGLLDAFDRRIGGYSKGMRQKLALVRALIHNPPVLLLDEPTSAMDPHSARLVRDAIADLRGDGRTIILTTHNLPEAEELSDRIAIIRRGEIVAKGSNLELKASLLGPPLLEIRFADAVNGVVEDMSDMVEIISSDHNWVRYRTPDPAKMNPMLVKMLSEQGASVVTLSEVPQSLEQVYLRVVSGDEVVETTEGVEIVS